MLLLIYMYQAVLLKFSQNDALKGFLLSASGNVLVEASDKFWEIRLSIKSPIYSTKQNRHERIWQGRHLKE